MGSPARVVELPLPVACGFAEPIGVAGTLLVGRRLLLSQSAPFQYIFPAFRLAWCAARIGGRIVVHSTFITLCCAGAHADFWHLAQTVETYELSA